MTKTLSSIKEMIEALEEERANESWYVKLWDAICYPFCRLKGFYYNLKNGIWQIIVWMPVIYNQRDYESEDMYDLMLYKIKRIKKEHKGDRAFTISLYNEEEIEKDQDFKDQIARDKRQYQRMKRCEDLLEKLIADEYFDMEDDNVTKSYYYVLEQKEQDRRELHSILAKYLDCWWS